MKIITLGICIDNNDPAGLGRIRCQEYDDYVGGKEHVVNYKPFDKNDPFVASPFLPPNINFIPENGQAVKIIWYDNEKRIVNHEYIAGPFTTQHDYNSQTFTQQIANTSYGVPIKSNIKIPEKSKNSYTKVTDFSINGKYGSDVIFTNGGVVLRGGKLLSKDSATTKERKEISDYPLLSKKVAKLQLKKFPEKRNLKEDVITKITYDEADLKYLIEYSVDDLTTPTTISFYIYQITTSYDNIFKTSQFTQYTEIPSSGCTLLNDVGTGNTPTFIINLYDLSGYSGTLLLDEKIKQIYSTIRLKINDFRKNGLSINDISSTISARFSSNTNDSLTNIYPFYFRPTAEFRNRIVTPTEKTTKQSILNGIYLTSQGPQEYGLVWSLNEFTPPEKIIEEKINSLKKDTSSREQTFASIVSDYLFLLSSDTNFTDKPIDFGMLDSYEYTQEDYLGKIHPNTYAIVRGEPLLKLLIAFYNVLITHIHNINKPYIKNGYSPHDEMERLIRTIGNDLLNNSIRIN